MILSKKILLKRAKFLTKIRQFFLRKGVLEVETPLLYPYPASDPYVDAFSIDIQPSGKFFLQTSPEFAMKRLLAAHSSSIYQICKAFRNDPKAKYHNQEFTILEWYRVGFNEKDLRKEIIEMLLLFSPNAIIHQYSYRDLFIKFIGINPHTADIFDLQSQVLKKIGKVKGLNQPNKVDCLDLLFTHLIEPKLKLYEFVFVYDYPKSQAALARVMQNQEGELVAKRFEMFYQGIELANGYYELTDPEEQLRRCKNDLTIRRSIGKEKVPIDNELLSVLTNIPECSGVALGLDRLIMCMSGCCRLQEVIYQL